MLKEKIFKKYEFPNENEALNHINQLPSGLNALGGISPTHTHHIAKLGYLPIGDAVYDENGNEVTPPTFSNTYSVDILWDKSELLDDEGEIIYPSGWVENEIQYNENWISNNGAHTFAGWEFI